MINSRNNAQVATVPLVRDKGLAVISNTDFYNVFCQFIW